MAKEREDVNKLVSDLIGGGTAPASSSSKSPTPKAAVDSPAKEPQKQVTPGSVGRSKPVKLVIDQMAPVNIRPKVGMLYTCTCTCNYLLLVTPITLVCALSSIFEVYAK